MAVDYCIIGSRLKQARIDKKLTQEKKISMPKILCAKINKEINAARCTVTHNCSQVPRTCNSTK